LPVCSEYLYQLRIEGGSAPAPGHDAQPGVVIPLQRNLLYTGITRGKKLVVVGSRRALSAAVQRRDAAQRYSALARRLQEA
jgi:exodeoxyribonuclease V alpha subunit